MRILIIKLSSMGDILHTLPALTECLAYFPQLKIDWVVEPGFKDILSWHPGIQHIYTFPLRAARKQPKLWLTEIPKALKKIRSQHYDLVIDAQGLMKSALLARLVKTKRIVGLDKYSCREPFASKFYHQGYAVSWSEHAVTRVKQLFSQIFGYPLSSGINYGIDKGKLIQSASFKAGSDEKYLVFLHGTTWQTKHWPESYWRDLIALVYKKNPELKILLPWGSEEEFARASRLSKVNTQVQVLPKLSISELAYYIAHAEFVVAVDTGLGHLAAALGTKTINLYGATDPHRTGTVGLNQIHLAASQLNPEAYSCSPCLKRQCIYPNNNEQQQVFPPCYQVVSPDKVIEGLGL
jgi:heptosyltransferase-1